MRRHKEIQELQHQGYLSQRVTVPRKANLETELRSELSSHAQEILLPLLLTETAGKCFSGEGLIQIWKSIAGSKLRKIHQTRLWHPEGMRDHNFYITQERLLCFYKNKPLGVKAWKEYENLEDE